MRKMPGTSKARPLPTTRAASLQPFLAVLQSKGVATQALLERARVDAALLGHDSALLPLDSCLQFLDMAAAEAGTESLGIEVGLATPLEALGPYGRGLRGCKTLAEYILQGVKRYNRHTSGLSLQLQRHERHWRVIQPWAPQLTERRGQALAHLNTLAITINSCRAAAGKTWCPPTANISKYCEPAMSYCGLFVSTELRRQDAATWCDIPIDLLGLPLWGSYGSSTHEELQPLTGALSDCVKQQIQAMIDRSDLSLPAVAKSLGVSPRSIQRHLGREGLSFFELHDQCRYHTAVNELTGSDKPVTDIAFDLGYTDPSNFTRAFRRWTGVCPVEFRAAVSIPH
ncbi:MAG: helix-turn-helix domain-containing protein [Halieaceae bacterium]|jgi:AraC-like DNA-binding protein|nr:helix-turn-helix domain-containing protein [Halieaceae bacterium]